MRIRWIFEFAHRHCLVETIVSLIQFKLSTTNTTMSADNLQSMKYTNEGGASPQLKVLDQLLIPHEKVYIDVPDVEMAYTVIKTMQIRGRCWNQVLQ